MSLIEEVWAREILDSRVRKNVKMTLFTKLLLLLTLAVFPFSLFGQSIEKYEKSISEAEDFYDAKDYANAQLKYEKSFVFLEKRAVYEFAINDRYKAAVAAVSANRFDFAFEQLFKIVGDSRYYTLSEGIVSSEKFAPLHGDKRWKKLIETIEKKDSKMAAGYDKSLYETLNAVYDEDQKYRLQSNEIEKKYGINSREMEQLWETIDRTDAENLKKVTKILDENGWLGADKIGYKATRTLFLVIQHARPKIQEKYLPIMREAVKNGKANASSLALLEDRVALSQGRKQIYGSQLFTDNTGKTTLQPIEDPDNVDKRRRSVGLGSLKNYLLNFGIVWNLEEFKKSLQ